MSNLQAISGELTKKATNKEIAKNFEILLQPTPSEFWLNKSLTSRMDNFQLTLDLMALQQEISLRKQMENLSSKVMAIQTKQAAELCKFALSLIELGATPFTFGLPLIRTAKSIFNLYMLDKEAQELVDSCFLYVKILGYLLQRRLFVLRTPRDGLASETQTAANRIETCGATVSMLMDFTSEILGLTVPPAVDSLLPGLLENASAGVGGVANLLDGKAKHLKQKIDQHRHAVHCQFCHDQIIGNRYKCIECLSRYKDSDCCQRCVRMNRCSEGHPFTLLGGPDADHIICDRCELPSYGAWWNCTDKGCFFDLCEWCYSVYHVEYQHQHQLRYKIQPYSGPLHLQHEHAYYREPAYNSYSSYSNYYHQGSQQYANYQNSLSNNSVNGNGLSLIKSKLKSKLSKYF